MKAPCGAYCCTVVLSVRNIKSGNSPDAMVRFSFSLNPLVSTAVTFKSTLVYSLIKSTTYQSSWNGQLA